MKTIMEEKELQERPLNEKESLEIITRMIRNTQKRLERGVGAPMLIWGYATIITTIAVRIAFKLTSDYNCHYLWFIIPVTGITGMLLRKKRPREVRTYIDRVIGYIWLVLGTTAFLLSALSMVNFMWKLPILFVIIIIMGIGSTLTGLVTEFKPMIAGGIAGLLLSIVHYLIPGYDIKMLTFAFAFIVMYIIPGHILNYRAKKACLKN